MAFDAALPGFALQLWVVLFLAVHAFASVFSFVYGIGLLPKHRTYGICVCVAAAVSLGIIAVGLLGWVKRHIRLLTAFLQLACVVVLVLVVTLTYSASLFFIHLCCLSEAIAVASQVTVFSIWVCLACVTVSFRAMLVAFSKGSARDHAGGIQ